MINYEWKQPNTMRKCYLTRVLYIINGAWSQFLSNFILLLLVALVVLHFKKLIVSRRVISKIQN